MYKESVDLLDSLYVGSYNHEHEQWFWNLARQWSML